MDEQDRYANEQHIRRLADRLEKELDPPRHAALQDVLIEEWNGSGLVSWKLEFASQRIKEGHARIENQHRLIEHLIAEGRDVTVAKNILENLLRNRELFEMLRKQAFTS